MRRRGSILVEVMISILIFTIGIVALAGSIMFSLRMVVQSGVATQLEQDAINKYEEYLIEQFIDGTGDTAGATLVSNDFIDFDITGGNKTINYNLYKYGVSDKKGSEIYVIQRNN